MRKEKYYVLRSQRNSKWFFVSIIGITSFIFIIFPFFAVNLRYQVGAVFSNVFDKFGVACISIGGVLILITLFNLLFGKKVRVGGFVIGIILVWIGCWCTGTVLEIFGLTFGTETTNPGYH
jgi:uncharacterized membrane protein YqgA involved in biofilm formation